MTNERERQTYYGALNLLTHEFHLYEPVMRRGLATPDEKKATQGYTDSGSGVPEVERPWCLQPVYEPDPRTVFRHHAMLPPPR
jgi:hypothetical protein